MRLAVQYLNKRWVNFSSSSAKIDKAHDDRKIGMSILLDVDQTERWFSCLVWLVNSSSDRLARIDQG
jgi:hypothetical protein